MPPPLSPPLISVSKSEAIIHVVPAALRFWEKLGLGPKGGKKNITVFVIYEQSLNDNETEQHAQSWRSERIGSWLKHTCDSYKARALGEMCPGKSKLCQIDGLISFRFDMSFKKNLTTFISSLPFLSSEDAVVFFVMVPLPLMNLSSQMLRHVSSAVNKPMNFCSEVQQPFFQFVPESNILNAALHSSSPYDNYSGLFLRSVYDRVLVPSERAMSRKFFTYGQVEKQYFEVPAFTLARPYTENKISYSGSTDPGLDVLDRHTLLHVGYGISACGRWIFASCIDQRGEAHNTGVWSLQQGTTNIAYDLYIVNRVWDFAMQFANRARVEWRIVVAKLGKMSIAELDAWNAHLYTISQSTTQVPLHVSVLNVQSSTLWTPSPLPSSTHPPLTTVTAKGSSRSASSSMNVSSKNSFFVDITATTYGLRRKDPFPISSPPDLDDIGLSSGFVRPPSALTTENDDIFMGDERPLLPLSSSTLLCIPNAPVQPRMLSIHLINCAKSAGCTYPANASDAAEASESLHNLLRDVTHSYYSLSVLSSVRWNTTSSLPFHLGAVETMQKALSTRNGLASMDGYS
ncbi:mediator complex subunit 13 C-terminal-domain-containing protein [Lentinula raphanica]|nr:mediator complex subunit 13 C-terminal-domain-containing protein [Lentinula raphanica]